MKKRLILVRHGQTLFNTLHKIQGWCDSPLTDTGIEQAKAAGKWIADKGWQFDHAYSSTSERCCDTLECITDLPYTRLKGLKEKNFGRFEGQDEFLHAPWDMFGTYYKNFGGDTEEEVAARMAGCLQDLMAKADHQSVLAVSHAGSILTFLSSIADLQPGKAKMPNCAVCELEYDDETDTFALLGIYDPGNGEGSSHAAV